MSQTQRILKTNRKKYVRRKFSGKSITRHLSFDDRLMLQLRKCAIGGCWEWMGHKSKGYGIIVLNGKKYSVHRITWERERGPVPNNLELDHLCRNKACANPSHLEPVTHSENLRRSNLLAWNHPSRKQTHCKRGHEFDEENTYHYNGLRHCRHCRRLEKRSRRMKSNLWVEQ